jgi:hypothetical protein
MDGKRRSPVKNSSALHRLGFHGVPDQLTAFGKPNDIRAGKEKGATQFKRMRSLCTFKRI